MEGGAPSSVSLTSSGEQGPNITLEEWRCSSSRRVIFRIFLLFVWGRSSWSYIRVLLGCAIVFLTACVILVSTIVIFLVNTTLPMISFFINKRFCFCLFPLPLLVFITTVFTFDRVLLVVIEISTIRSQDLGALSSNPGFPRILRCVLVEPRDGLTFLRLSIPSASCSGVPLHKHLIAVQYHGVGLYRPDVVVQLSESFSRGQRPRTASLDRPSGHEGYQFAKTASTKIIFAATRESQPGFIIGQTGTMFIYFISVCVAHVIPSFF